MDTFVKQVQALYNWYNTLLPRASHAAPTVQQFADENLVEDGELGPKTTAAVRDWWQQTMGVDAPSLHERLGVEPAALNAVIEIESPQGAFDRQGRPPILFEAHHFHKHTKGRYTFTHPHLSSRYWDRSLYTNDEYQRLDEAVQLNEAAAYKSASWGKYQILGLNYAECGHPTVQSFVEAMRSSEQAQDEAFVNFIKSQPKIHYALQQKDWETFARLYNGPGYKTHRYDERLAQAYERHAAERTT